MKTDLAEKIKNRIDRLPKSQLNEFGVDPYGFDPSYVRSFAPALAWLYEKYFRVEVYGAENLPKGRMMVISNHSGQLPFDGLMIGTAFLVEPKTPRYVRGMAERWSADLPFISTLFARSGAVVGDPNTCKDLLHRNEAVIVFPEGVKGISKLYTERYQLLRFGHGFMRCALEGQAPIVPVAVIGAEEQAPAVANIMPLAKLLGMPALPIIFPQVVPLPLPVKYRIHIGKPLWFSGDGTEDSDIIAKYVQQTRSHIQNMIDEGLKKRHSIFF